MAEQTKTLIEKEFLKPEELKTEWPWRLLVFTIFLFGIILLVFFGMRIGYEPYLDKKIKTLDAEIGKLTQSFSQSQINDFLKFYSQLSNLKTLLGNHIFSSNILKFLEENSLKNLIYTSLNLDVGRRELKLSGIVSSYEVLSQQLEIFRQSTLVEKSSFKNSQRGEKTGINFEIVLVLKNDFFKEGSILSASPVIPISTSTSSVSGEEINSTSTQP